MAKVWIFNGVTGEWEQPDVPNHAHSEFDDFYTKDEVDALFPTFTYVSNNYALKDHTHDGHYLRPQDVLGDMIVNNGDGTITISAALIDEVQIGLEGPRAPDNLKLYVETEGDGVFALFPPADEEVRRGDSALITSREPASGLKPAGTVWIQY
jgi:hypothetical protein